MKYKRSFSLLTLALAGSTLLPSCSEDFDKDKDGFPGKKDKCPTEAGVAPDGCPVKKEIGNVHFFVDNSASMGAYFKDGGFNNIVSDLSVKVDKTIKPIDIFFIADATEKYNGNAQRFSTDIATTSIRQQKSSQLHKMIADVAAHTDSNDVSLLVSDCILSFPDADIKKDPEINRNAAAGTLKNYIFSTFSDLKKKGLATSVYAFTARPSGVYYNYQNGKTPLKGDHVRPFYVWVIANKNLLPVFDAQLNDISTFKPEQSLHFGLADEPVKTYEIIPGLEKNGEWMKAANGAGVEEIKADDQFCIAVNLDGLPEYAKDKSYLQEHLNVTGKGCEVSFKVKDKNNINKDKLRSEPQIKDFEAATHFILITVKEMPARTASIAVDLPLEYDTWYKAWSVMDDRNISAAEKKTFALEHLIDGVREAYDTKNNSYLHFPIALTK